MFYIPPTTNTIIMTIQCPQCSELVKNESDLEKHLKHEHHATPEDIKKILRGSGWYEPKQETPAGKISVEHRIAALKAINARNPAISVPIIPMNERHEIKIPAGWVPEGDNTYSYKKEIATIHNYNDTTTQTVTARVAPHHGIAELHTFFKDISALRKLQEKESQLSSRISRYVVSDPEFPEIAKELHKVKKEIEAVSRSIRPEETAEMITGGEQYFDTNQEEAILHQEMTDFMNKVNGETDRLINNAKRASLSPVKNEA